MSDADHAARWALDDEELEALMIGATPDDLGRVGNPVAEFFVDARAARGVQSPSPDDALRHLFAGEGLAVDANPAPRPVIGAVPPHPARPPQQQPTPQQLPPMEQLPPLERPQPSPAPRPIPSRHQSLDPLEPVGHESHPDPYAMAPASPLFGDPGDVGLDATSVDHRPRGTLLNEHTARHEAYRPSYHHEYDSSPLGYLGQVLRPTGPKVLMGLATVALFLTAGQLLGVMNLPFFGESGVDNQAIGESAIGAPASPAADDPANGEGQQSGAPADLSTSLVTVPLPTASLPGPTVTLGRQATTAPTVAENTTTPTISVPPSSEGETTVSVDPNDTTTSIDPTTSDPTATTDTNPTTTEGATTSTEVTTSTPAATVTVVTGKAYLPAERPNGTWTAEAGAGCEVRTLVQGGGSETTHTPVGGTITVPVGATDIVIVGAGCPTTFTVT